MKRLLAVAFIFLFCFNGTHFINRTIHSSGGAASPCTGSNPSDCTFRDTFNGSSLCATSYTSNCDNATGWIVSLGTPVFNDTNYPASGQTYAMSLTNVTQVRTATALTASDTQYAAIRVYIETVGYTNTVMEFKNGSTSVGYLGLSSGNLTVTAVGGTQSSTIGTVSAGNEYYIRIMYTLGSGSDAVITGWLSTDGTSWGTPQSSSDGTSTAQADRFYIYASTVPSFHVREVRVYTGSISW